MKKRFIWLTAICIVIVSIVAATAAYASHFVNTVNQTHIASGPITYPLLRQHPERPLRLPVHKHFRLCLSRLPHLIVYMKT